MCTVTYFEVCKGRREEAGTGTENGNKVVVHSDWTVMVMWPWRLRDCHQLRCIFMHMACRKVNNNGDIAVLKLSSPK